jgi:restriction system protein
MSKTIYHMQVWHEGLGKYREIRGYDANVVEQKAQAQRHQWDEMWTRRQEADARKEDRERAARERQSKKDLAISRTCEAQEAIEQLRKILSSAPLQDATLDWETLKLKGDFPESKPKEPPQTPTPRYPDENDPKYKPKLGILDYIVTSSKRKKTEQATELFNLDYRKWQSEKERISALNAKAHQDYIDAVNTWKANTEKWFINKKKHNQEVDERKLKYSQKDPDGITDYCETVLSKSEYPDWFPQDYDLDYNPSNKMLIVEYSLPELDAMPTIAEVKYIQARDEFKEMLLSTTAINQLYDSLIYQITLRSIHELFEADAVDALNSIVFNGWVHAVDKATGQEIRICLNSIQANRDEFMGINLAAVDPKACFKKLKGVGSSKLHGLAAWSTGFTFAGNTTGRNHH